MNTRLFGEIDIQKDKVICFENGIIGFPDYKEYALIYDSEKKDKKGVSWLQCLEDEVFALPVIDPLSVKPDYAPECGEHLCSCDAYGDRKERRYHGELKGTDHHQHRYEKSDPGHSGGRLSG